MISKNKIKNKLTLSLTTLITLLLIFSFTISAFSAETLTIDEQLEQLKGIIDFSSYSAFQSRMILNTAQDLLESGISFEDTKNIIENSVEESFDAYSVKKVFDIILETQQEGLPAETLINKVNEGFAKNVDNSVLISVISTKAENLKKANEILNEALQEGLEINGEEEMVGILADSLENDVPQESLFWLLKTGATEGSSIEEITEISEELSYLSLLAYDSGLSICENIQTSLDAEISTAKPSSSITTNSGTLPTSSTGSPVEVGETPTQEAGEAPTETGSAPEPSSPPAEEAPAPPEN